MGTVSYTHLDVYKRQQQYVDSLRAVAALAAQKEEKAETPAAPLFAALCRDAQALCAKAGLRFQQAVPQLSLIHI